MLKTIGCLLILGASTAGGFVFAESFKKRVRELNELERCMNQLQSEIEYTYTPLPEALRNVALKSNEPIKDVFMEASELLYLNKVETVHEAFAQSLDKKVNSLNLKKEDISIVLDLSKSLGETDIEGHKKMFSLTLSNLKKKVSEAELLMSKNLKMYRYLGFSIGAMIVIVLV